MSKYSFLFWSLWFHLVICCSKSAAWLTAEFCSWLAIWVWTCCHSSVPQSLPCRLWLHMLSALQDCSPCIVQCDEVVIHLYVNNHYQQVEQGSFRLNLNPKIQQHWRYEKERFLPNECRSWKFYVSDVGFWHQHDLLWKKSLEYQQTLLLTRDLSSPGFMCLHLTRALGRVWMLLVFPLQHLPVHTSTSDIHQFEKVGLLIGVTVNTNA